MIREIKKQRQGQRKTDKRTDSGVCVCVCVTESIDILLLLTVYRKKTVSMFYRVKAKDHNYYFCSLTVVIFSRLLLKMLSLKLFCKKIFLSFCE